MARRQAFRWNQWNIDHVGEHGVLPDEAEQVVCSAKRPYPRKAENGKWLAWGATREGRLLQVIFVLDNGTAFVIHARPLTPREKQRFRRQK
jgi:uncharacterized DUF497 family protein